MRAACRASPGLFSGPRPRPRLTGSAAMVAGMFMPLDQLRAIYEVLFREGVMVAKKDRRPRSLHPHVPGVTNLQVMCAMASLRARGLVRETFTWRHFYWYLTNEGIAHLRQYLHLPPEIVPASLQRVRRPVAMVMPARRTPHVQDVQGPLGCPPKRGPLPTEDPAREERWVYRRKEPEEGATEPPVVPATTPGTLARQGLEPAPPTGSCALAPAGGWGCGGLGLGLVDGVGSRCAKALLLPAGGALSAWALLPVDAGAPPPGLRILGWVDQGGARGLLPPIARHTPGLGVGLAVLGLAGPAVGTALAGTLGPLASITCALPAPSLPQGFVCSRLSLQGVGTCGEGAGMGRGMAALPSVDECLVFLSRGLVQQG